MPPDGRVLTAATRVWRSDTAMSWAAQLVRVGGGFVLLVAAARLFDPETVAVWLLFRIILGLRILAESGLGTTFSRVLAFGMGGAEEIGDLRGSAPQTVGRPHWPVIDQIWDAMGGVYRAAGALAFVVLAFAVSPLMSKTVSALPSPAEGWMAWLVMALSIATILWGARYVVYLIGVGEVALVRRWEAVLRTAALVGGLLAMLSGRGLLVLVLVMQGFECLIVATNAWLVRGARQGRPSRGDTPVTSGDIVRIVWPRAWRNALGVSMITGLNQVSNLVLAQLFGGVQLASYLFAYRLFDSVNMFSMAPFYSKLPVLARLHAAGERSQEVLLARRRMALSLWSYSAGCAATAVLGPGLFKLLDISLPFADPWLAALLMAAFFAERLGAMHLQLYTTTNHEVGHLMNGSYAMLFLGFALLLVPRLGLYGFPATMLLAHLAFPLWWSMTLTRREFGLRWKTFHAPVTAPLLLLLAGLLGLLAVTGGSLPRFAR